MFWLKFREIKGDLATSSAYFWAELWGIWDRRHDDGRCTAGGGYSGAEVGEREAGRARGAEAIGRGERSARADQLVDRLSDEERRCVRPSRPARIEPREYGGAGEAGEVVDPAW